LNLSERTGYRKPTAHCANFPYMQQTKIRTPTGAVATLWIRNDLFGAEGLIACVGEIEAAEPYDARELLRCAAERATASGCSRIVGPLDGDTWHRYRVNVGPHDEPPFFLEPRNPDWWEEVFRSSGFQEEAAYFTALHEDLAKRDSRIDRARARLEAGGVTIRTFRPDAAEEDLRLLHRVSLEAFAHNHLYSPIGEEAFRGMFEPLLGVLDFRFVLIAERGGESVGFVFAFPEFEEGKRRGKIETLVVKTVAVRDGRPQAGLGAVLVGMVEDVARAAGFRRSIHALMHENNVSRNLSAKTTHPIRRYVLFSKTLLAG